MNSSGLASSPSRRPSLRSGQAFSARITSQPNGSVSPQDLTTERRVRRVLKDRLGHYARPEGRLLAVWAFHRQIYPTHTLGAQCASFGFSSPSSRSPSSPGHSTHNAAASTCTGTRDAMDRTSHHTPDRLRTAAATPHRRQRRAATPRRGVAPIQLRRLSGRRALDTTAHRRHARTKDGSIEAAKREMTSCGAAGIRTVGPATWWTMSCRSARAGRTRRATCSGRPSRKGR